MLPSSGEPDSSDPVIIPIAPVAGPITQEIHGHHRAVDQACIAGSPVVAMIDGNGSFHWDYYKGWVFTQGNFSIAHLAHSGPSRYYYQGEIISACGSTGAYSTGPHVHVEGPERELRQLYRL